MSIVERPSASQRRARTAVAASLPALLLLAAPAAGSDLKPEEVPEFAVRLRVVSVAGKPPADDATFRVSLLKSTATVKGSVLSPAVTFDRAAAEATIKTYPATYIKRWPVVVRVSVSPVTDPTVVEGELTLPGKDGKPGEVVALKGELYGPSLGLVIWRDADGTPHAATHARYNHRYWEALAPAALPPDKRPKHFPIVERFIGGDNDRIAWREGIGHLAAMGVTAVMLPPDKRLRDMLLETGLRRTAWAVYSPPGYAFDFDPKVTPESITKWAEQQAAPYRAAGYAPEDMALFAMSDEPGWYYPRALADLAGQPAALARFREWLKARGLTPAELGAADWDAVQPTGRGAVIAADADLPARKRFYWTMRFFAADSARHFGACSAALQKAFRPGLPIFTNWNFFSGRHYVPGPVANNADKQSPDAAMGGHDWTEFARAKGGTMLWTEDWFGDGRAYAWSYYAARMRTAAETGGIEFGCYVIPRTAGSREAGLLQKIMACTGHGAKGLKYFVFGPEYNFPSNCWSERSRLAPKLAAAHGMIAAGEELLWPGRTPPRGVALLHPRSSQSWDLRSQQVARGMSDATNTDLNNATADHLAELFDLHLALQHGAVPADILDEDALTPAGLANVKVLYVTASHLPAETRGPLLDWVKAGGSLVTVSGAGRADRYDDPLPLPAELRFPVKVRGPLPVPSAARLPVVGMLDLVGNPSAVGVRDEWESDPAAGDEVLARFADGKPAVVSRKVGAGRVVHFAFLPGLSWWRSQKGTEDGLPVGFDEGLRTLITAPALAGLGGVLPAKPSLPAVEAPVLASDKGWAVTLLNWRGKPVESLTVELRPGFVPSSITSVTHGKLEVKRSSDGASVSVELPLAAADVLMVRK